MIFLKKLQHLADAIIDYIHIALVNLEHMIIIIISRAEHRYWICIIA